MVVTDFNGRTSPSDGVTMLTIQVGTIKRPTLFVVVPSRASYNLLLGRDWIHAVGAIPSTLHHKMILWNDDGFVESIEADDSPCYMQQCHADYKIYNPQLKPMKVDESFDKEYLEVCVMDCNGIHLVPKAAFCRPSDELV